MFPAWEGLGELLPDEAGLQEDADGAPARALGQARGIAERQVAEPPGGIESALKRGSVKVRVEPKQVTW